MATVICVKEDPSEIGGNTERGYWALPGDPTVVLALDRNEAIAIRNACREYRNACGDATNSTSLNAGGGRVHDALLGLGLGH